jgi:hypothetical protein
VMILTCVLGFDFREIGGLIRRDKEGVLLILIIIIIIKKHY